jgi:acetamidase/formamidase
VVIDVAERRVERHQLHYGWDHATEPCLVVAPGDVVEFDTLDSSGGQISPASTVADIARFDFAKVNPAFGPVFVEGAQPGDALQVTVLELQTADWGWTANIPGFGLLAGGFTEPALHLWQLDPKTMAPATYAPGGCVPLKPFPGIMGLAPHEPGLHSVVNPRRVGGNIDTRDIAVGSKLLLPVEVAGALFSCGDGHAAQGDGEICGVALETPMRITVRLDLLRDAHVRWPRFTTPGPVTRHLDEHGYEVTMGIAQDLLEAACIAAREMVQLISAEHAMSELDAYLLCSVCADLRISEVVDEPDWIVSLYFPRVVFA